MTEAHISDTQLKISTEFAGLTEVVPLLRSLINLNTAGSIQPIFNIYKQHFEALFLLSSDKKDMNTDVIKEVLEWIKNKHNPLYPSDIEQGIELFYRYKSELFRLNILE